MPTTFPAYVVREDSNGNLSAGPQVYSAADLPKHPIEIAIEFSSLNFKDALSASGHKGISPNLPHIPGIDAAGIRMDTKEAIIITGFDFGMGTPGGFASFGKVPEEWLIPMPSKLDAKTAMAYGTAGLTAALCVDALIHEGCTPEKGPLLVSGASGGVGSIALSLLAKLGYAVHAVSSKVEAHDWLRERGAQKVITPVEFLVGGEKSLLHPEYSGAVDTVGGDMLHRILRGLCFGGAVATCGMVGGTELSTNIYPFILRAVRLIGIASADTSVEKKISIWQLLADEWSIPDILDISREVELEGLTTEIDRILNGRQKGRVIVRLPS